MTLDAELKSHLVPRLLKYKSARYAEIRDLTDRTDVSEHIAADGGRIRLEIAAVWDVEDADGVWVYGTARHLRFPRESITLGFLVDGDGQLVTQDSDLEQSA